jgi:hypothetical protein
MHGVIAQKTGVFRKDISRSSSQSSMKFLKIE